jgi:hypothetical protein
MGGTSTTRLYTSSSAWRAIRPISGVTRQTVSAALRCCRRLQATVMAPGRKLSFMTINVTNA